MLSFSEAVAVDVNRQKRSKGFKRKQPQKNLLTKTKEPERLAVEKFEKIAK